MKQGVVPEKRFYVGQRVKILNHTDACWRSKPTLRNKHIGATGVIERIWDDGVIGVVLTPTHACYATKITPVRKRGRPPKNQWLSIEDMKKK